MAWAASNKNGSGFPRFLCPHFSWEDHSLLGPFDPTVCACLDVVIPKTEYTRTRRFKAKTNRWQLWLQMKRRIDTIENISWYHQVDPGTWTRVFARHEALKHRAWCNEAQCVTSYRGRKLARLLLVEGEPWDVGDPDDSHHELAS